MKINDLNKSLWIRVNPIFTEETESLRYGFNWGIATDCVVESTDEEGTKLFIPNQNGDIKTAINIQMMRLFCCSMINALINKNGKVDQNVFHEINFLNDDPESKKFITDNIQILMDELLKEILYQNNPIKPTKNKLESLSLISKQSEN